MNLIESLKHVLLSSGSTWVMWLLLGLSLVSVGFMVERWLYYRSVSGDLRALADRLDAFLQKRDFAGAIEMLGSSRAVAASIARAGLRLADRGAAAAEKAMASATAFEKVRLERWLAYLGTLGNNAPFVGLFGTVIGVIHAFEELGHGAPGHGGGGAASNVASQAVMASIAEALVATAVGLLVALPAVAAYNYFQRRMQGLLGGTDVLTNLVLAYLVDEKNPAQAPSQAQAKSNES